MYKVYIIEDDPMITRINEKFINKLDNFRVIGSSSSATHAIENIDKLNPDLILLDVFMPGLNGIDLLKQFRAGNKKYEVMMITAAQDTETISEALQLGVIDYLIKPYEFSRLKKALDSFVAKITLIQDSSILTQNELDKIHFINNKSVESQQAFQENLPKGLDKITLNKVHTIIESTKNALSSKDVAKTMGVSRITTRKYLEYLAQQNIIDIHLQYGSTGRPTKLYNRKSKKDGSNLKL